MHKEIPPAVLDAALSSIGTFVIGFYAARSFAPAHLGGFALAYGAFMLVSRVPAQLLFKPAEIILVSHPATQRLGFLRQTLRLGTGPALIAALTAALWVPFAPSSVPADVVFGLTVTAVAASFFSPIQDHVRHMLHLGEASWRAAAVSGVQCLGAIGALQLLRYTGAPTSWRPLGALALANLLSLFAGLILARGDSGSHLVLDGLSSPELLRSGRWLLVVNLLPAGAAFIAAAIVSHVAGAAALGYSEGARVLGQPPFVLSMALGAIFGPRSIRAAQTRQLREARQVSRLYAILMLLCGLPYLLVVGFAWRWSPLVALLPNAYHVSGLVAVTVMGNMLIGMDWPYRSELLGGGRGADVAKLELVASAARAGAAGTAHITGPFAIPGGFIVHAAVRSIGYRFALRSFWQQQTHGEPAGFPAPVSQVDSQPMIVP
jgi:O-antigen/teichoic acid export membrane protein